MFKFEVIASDKKARGGKLVTPHGIVETPTFLPVGTQASVKSLTPRDLKEIGVEMILGNTYHLFLRPGARTVQKLGGLHQFMNWTGPILTDSGGFQVFSLGFGIEHQVGKMTDLFAKNMFLGETVAIDPKALVVRTRFCKIEEEGPTFQSHLDGSVHFFSPEISVETQVKLGADFVVALDECTSPLHDFNYTKVSMERSHRWELRSLEHFQKYKAKDKGSETQEKKRETGGKWQEMFGVIQGGPFEDLRVESAKFVSKNDFFGVGIGGALVSKGKMREILEWVYPSLDPEKPRHLLGIGTIDDIFAAVERGVDIFDCVHPTRLARMGHVLYKLDTGEKNMFGVYNRDRFAFDITKAVFKEDGGPIDPDCRCSTCQNFSRAYINHLFRSRELLAYRLATVHNVSFMMRFMEEIRLAIAQRRFAKLKDNWLS